MLIMIKIIYTLDDILDSTLFYLSHYAIWDSALCIYQNFTIYLSHYATLQFLLRHSDVFVIEPLFNRSNFSDGYSVIKPFSLLDEVFFHFTLF